MASSAATIEAIVRRAFGASVQIQRVRREHGGCSSASFRVDLRGATCDSLFVKLCDGLSVCEAEASGLRALRETDTVRVPQVFSVGREGDAAYIAMEYVPMAASRSDYAALGKALGKLHAFTRKDKDGEAAQQFGFAVDNYIGATPQLNTPRSDGWISFFKQNRLQFQLDLLRERRMCTDAALLQRVQRIVDRVDSFFDEDERIWPSLLHGDLWQGNWGFTTDKTPVIFDPACYWGHSEAELAMMTLFGDVPCAFYDAYFAEMPRASRFGDRVALYQLYHALNHYNMFGAGYQSLCDELVAQLEETLGRPARSG